MSDFESIIAANYTLGEMNTAEETQTAQFSRDLEVSVMTDNVRGYL